MYRDSPLCKNECYVCKATASYFTQMDIHHRSYLNIGNESPSDLVELCHPCHEKVHIIAKDKTIKMADICFAVEYLKHKWKSENKKKSKSSKPVKLLRVV
jgi:hypothetical protein